MYRDDSFKMDGKRNEADLLDKVSDHSMNVGCENDGARGRRHELSVP